MSFQNHWLSPARKTVIFHCRSTKIADLYHKPMKKLNWAKHEQNVGVQPSILTYWSLKSCYQEKSNHNDKQKYIVKCDVCCRSLWQVGHFVIMHMIKDMSNRWGPSLLLCLSLICLTNLCFYSECYFNLMLCTAWWLYVKYILCCILYCDFMWNVILVIRLSINFIWF